MRVCRYSRMIYGIMRTAIVRMVVRPSGGVGAGAALLFLSDSERIEFTMAAKTLRTRIAQRPLSRPLQLPGVTLDFAASEAFGAAGSKRRSARAPKSRRWGKKMTAGVFGERDSV